jgi:hypothetical protein
VYFLISGSPVRFLTGPCSQFFFMTPLWLYSVQSALWRRFIYMHARAEREAARAGYAGHHELRSVVANTTYARQRNIYPDEGEHLNFS